MLAGTISGTVRRPQRGTPSPHWALPAWGHRESEGSLENEELKQIPLNPPFSKGEREEEYRAEF